MTDQLRALAEVSLENEFPDVRKPGPFTVGYIKGFIAGRTSAADEIEAERLDTDWEALGADAYINGLIKSAEIARKGRDD